MNFEAMYISFFLVISIFLMIKGVKLYSKKDIEINKFKPNYNKDDGPVEVKRSRSLSQGKITLMIIVCGLSASVLTYAIVGNGYLSILAFLLGFIFPKLWDNWYVKSQEKLVAGQMVQVAETMAVFLKTENNIVAALERSALDCGEPLKSKLIQTAHEIRLGIPMNTAFESLAKSINVPEMMIINIGVELQQQGMAINLASMLEQVQKNIRNRQALKEELSVMTAENKMAGWIVAIIPFATLALIRQAAPEFVAPLFTTTVGLGIFFGCVGIIAVGVYWLLQIAEMENV